MKLQLSNRIYSKAISWLLIVSFFLTFLPQKALAQTLPSPESLCQLENYSTETGKKLRIVCKAYNKNSFTLTTPEKVEPDLASIVFDENSYFNFKNAKGIYHQWILQNAEWNNQLYPVYALTYSEDTSYKSIKLLYFYISTDNNTKKGVNGLSCVVSSNFCSNIFLRNGSKKHYLFGIKASNSEKIPDFDHIVTPEKQQEIMEKGSDNLKSTLSAFKVIDVEMQEKPYGIAAPTAQKPSDGAKTSCTSKHIKPILTEGKADNETISKIKSDMEKQLKESGASDEAIAKVMKNMDDILGKPEEYVTVKRDNEIYKEFYSHNEALGYPTVEINDDTYGRFRWYIDRVNSINWKTEEDGNFFRGVVGMDTFKKMRDVLAVATTLPHALSLSYGFTIMKILKLSGNVTDSSYSSVTGYIDKLNTDQFKTLLKYEIEAGLAYTYLKANIEYRKCAIEAGDTKFGGDLKQLEKFETSIDALLESTTDAAANAAADNENKTICDEIEGNVIIASIGKAFCGLLLITHNWSQSFFLTALKLLQSSIGVESKSNP